MQCTTHSLYNLGPTPLRARLGITPKRHQKSRLSISIHHQARAENTIVQ